MTQKDYFPIGLNCQIDQFNTLNLHTKRLRREIFKAKIVYYFKEDKKKLLKKFFYWATPFIITAIGGYYVLGLIPTPKIIRKTDIVYKKEKTHQEFLDALAKKESGGKYDIVNPYGYCGKYQFGMQALADIGMPNLDKQEFLHNPELQELCMKMLLKKNKVYLQSYIGKYQSKTIKGIYITESGLLCGAHSIGYGAVVKWLESKGEIDPVDGNGVKVSIRIKEFGGYKLEL